MARAFHSIPAASTAAPPGDDADPTRKKSGKLRWSSLGRGRAAELTRSYFALVALVVLIIAGSQLSSGFLTGGNIRNLLSSNAPIGFVCVGMTFVIIGGAFDLSVGGIYALAAVVAATVANSLGTVEGILIGLAVGVVCGLINGVLVGVAGINSFIATLGTGSVFTGLAYIYSHNQSISVAPSSFGYLGNGDLAGIPFAIWILVILFAVAALVLRFTVYGRDLFATGGNMEAARLAGIRVGTMRASTFVIVGLLAALGGIAFTSELAEGQASIGPNIPLTAIAIVVIGGTSLFGGEGSIERTAVGFLLIGALTDVFNLLALNSSLEQVVEGAILVLTVSLNGTWTVGMRRWRKVEGPGVPASNGGR